MDYLSTESGHWEPKPLVVTLKVDMGPYVNAMKGVSSAFQALAERFATIEYSPAPRPLTAQIMPWSIPMQPAMSRDELAHTLTHLFGDPMSSTLFVGGAPRITIFEPVLATILRDREAIEVAFTVLLGTGSVVLIPRKGYTFVVAMENRAWFVSHKDAPWGMLVMAEDGALAVVRV